ncbi:3-oxoacyl-[acyl-carrier-protein] synthase II [Candidatus Gastranaerophilus sp. (ex Termes propinquus)]|nr:3-oxoacyl-[acyl-carrier-protein] synthase II [Candidatus Gastranaerophilus sp. (ex Termes propinquus)]
MQKRRVVITGIGIVSPYGVGLDKFWNSLKEGKSGIKKIARIDTEHHTVKIAGEIEDSALEGLLDPKETKRMDRYTQLAMIAADEAIKDANIAKDNVDPYRYGVIVGSAAGGFDTFEKQHLSVMEKGPTKCSPFTVPMIISDMGAGRISIKHGAKGINKAVITACATSAHCIGDAFRSIQYDDADIIVAGGAEAVITTLGIGAFTAARTLSKRNDEPEKASRPYDIDRDGFVMSEGAAILVLEELEHAKSRGAKIYAEIVGYGQTADAYDIVAPDPTGAGAKKAMETVVKEAGIEPSQIGYLNAHGTSTGLGDVAESKAIADVFGDLDKNPSLKVSSTKSMHGHMLGATGAAESIVCIEALRTGIIPPTINLDNQDPEVANLNYVPHKAITADIKYALTNSFGFGGHNASLLFKKYED